MHFLKKGSLLREVPIIVISALVVSIIVKTFFLHFFFIPSGSMENTLQVGDRIAVNKFGNLYSDIKRGEVVVFRDPAKWLGDLPPSTGSKITQKIKTGLELVGVLPDPSKQYLIKRVVGVGGDTVICCDKAGHLTVNGKSIKEPYIYTGNKASDTIFTAKVAKGFIWVMGDHRSASADSRFHTDDIYKGMVPLKDVVGRAFIVVWPFNDWQFLNVGHDLSKIAVNK